MGWRDRGVEVKTPEQVAMMRRAGVVVGRTLEMVRDLARPGLLGYHGFTGSLCVSVNDEVVHGVPGSRVLTDGDLVSIDCGAIVADDTGQGWHGDAAVTITLGDVPDDVRALVQVTEEAMWRGIAAARPDGRVTDISHAVEAHLRAAGPYGILEDYTGHGIGTEMHLPPDVPNYGKPGKGPRLVAGLALAVEPMVTLGSPDTDVLADDWTVVTRDGSWAAHSEHTFTLTPDGGTWVLTALDGGREALTALGVPYGGD